MLPACMAGGFGTHYKSYIDPLTASNVIALSEGEDPKIIVSENIGFDKERYEQMGFVIIGESNFETREEHRYLKVTFTKFDTKASEAFRQAKEVSATHVLYYREVIDEYNTTLYNKNEDKYETTFYDKFHNVAVYMVRKDGN